MTVPVREIGQPRTNRAVVGAGYNDRILVSAAISGQIIRVTSIDVDSIGRVSGTVQVAIQNSGSSGAGTILFEAGIRQMPDAAVADGYQVQNIPFRDFLPLTAPVTVVPPLQNGQALVVRTNVAATSGLMSATATYWADEE